MRTRIISAFPGTGKSYFHNNNKKYTSLDSDSSEFSWVTNEEGEKIRNPNFPANYIEHIKSNIGKVDFIFVSSHKEVRTALKDSCIFFYLVYPYEHNKETYIERYKERGSDQKFIDLISTNWSQWIRECEFEDVGCKKEQLCVGWTIENAIRHIVASEGGDKK